MKLDAILALRPADDAGTAELADSITRAEAHRAELLRSAAAAAVLRADVLAPDDKLKAAERTAAECRLAVERIEALLPQLRDRLLTASGVETVAALRAERAALEPELAELRRWQSDDFPRMRELIGVGFKAHDRAYAAIECWKANVIAAYAREEVRAAGELGVDLPQLQGPLPRHTFPGWK